MPIKGISDEFRLPRVGKIHLGVKKQGAKGEYPSPVPYFVVRESDTTPLEAAEAFKGIYHEEPTELHIMFPTNDPEDWSDQYLRYYTASWGLTCKGDGELGRAKWDGAAKTWASKQTKDWDWLYIDTCGEGCQLYQEGRCKPVMRLSFLLRDVPGLGIWQVDTSSVHSMRNINGMVELVRRITGGRIAFFPFTLSRRQITVQPKGEKSKSVYILDLRPEGLLTMAQAQALMESKAALPAAMLPVPDEEEVPEDLYPNGDKAEEVEPEEGLPDDAREDDLRLPWAPAEEVAPAMPKGKPLAPVAGLSPEEIQDAIADLQLPTGVIPRLLGAANLKAWIESGQSRRLALDLCQRLADRLAQGDLLTPAITAIRQEAGLEQAIEHELTIARDVTHSEQPPLMAEPE
jgi:hypothetical protein